MVPTPSRKGECWQETWTTRSVLGDNNNSHHVDGQCIQAKSCYRQKVGGEFTTGTADTLIRHQTKVSTCERGELRDNQKLFVPIRHLADDNWCIFIVTVTSNHLPRPHHESPKDDEKLSNMLTDRNWEKMENVEFWKFLSIISRKSYGISKIMIFEAVTR